MNAFLYFQGDNTSELAVKLLAKSANKKKGGYNTHELGEGIKLVKRGSFGFLAGEATIYVEIFRQFSNKEICSMTILTNRDWVYHASVVIKKFSVYTDFFRNGYLTTNYLLTFIRMCVLFLHVCIIKIDNWIYLAVHFGGISNLFIYFYVLSMILIKERGIQDREDRRWWMGKPKCLPQIFVIPVSMESTALAFFCLLGGSGLASVFLAFEIYYHAHSSNGKIKK